MRPFTLWILGAAAAAILAAEQNAPVIPQFVDEARQANINLRVVSGDPKEKRYLIESVGGGLAVLDYDNDGWMDLYIVNGGTIEDTVQQTRKFGSCLYRNNHDGTFSDVTDRAGVRNGFWGKGALAADFNNDGWTDLYVVNFGPNVLYQNNGDGTFRDVTAKARVGDPRWSSSAAAADYDRDGYLDIFVANYLEYDLRHLPVSGKFCSYRGIPVACGPRGLKGAGDALFHNNGDGTFTDVSVKAGVSDSAGYFGMGSAWGDFDNDGLPDLFVANDTTPNYLYRNNGDGTFTDVALETGVAFSEDGREQACMGVEFEDIDNDGWLDIFVTNFSDDYNTLYRNTGKGSFKDDSFVTGLVADSWKDLSWGVGFFDFNNDGWKDVFVANGHIYPQVDRYGLGISYRQTNKLYLNSGGQKLANVSSHAGAALRIAKSYRGAAFADFNNDGLMDIAIVALDDAPTLLMNRSANVNHWIMVRLLGTKSNRPGIGARISVVAGGLRQMREVKAGGSFGSTNDPRAHFGLGKAAVIEELSVVWPSGKKTVLRNVAPDRILTVEEDK